MIGEVRISDAVKDAVEIFLTKYGSLLNYHNFPFVFFLVCTLTFPIFDVKQMFFFPFVKSLVTTFACKVKFQVLGHCLNSDLKIFSDGTNCHAR